MSNSEFSPEDEASICRIFGDMPTYYRSLPATYWVRTGKKNDRGEPMWAGETQIIARDLANMKAA